VKVEEVKCMNSWIDRKKGRGAVVKKERGMIERGSLY
jgi:hypothetical protein